MVLLQVLQKFPNLCVLRYNKSSSSRTLLCQAVIATTMNVSSRQQESNLLTMVAVMLTVSTFFAQIEQIKVLIWKSLCHVCRSFHYHLSTIQ